MKVFYLGTIEASWLRRTSVPLFIHWRRFEKIRHNRNLPASHGPYAVDARSFNEVRLNGHFTFGPQTYVTALRRIYEHCGPFDWASIMDWMCEPSILQKTGLTVLEHQQRTIQSYMDLLNLAPDIPWCPVLQGWNEDDYFNHIEIYHKSGFDLSSLPIVGVGSVCKRQNTYAAARILKKISSLGINIHAFGFKTCGLKLAHELIYSADSHAWSFNAGLDKIRLPGCTHKAKSCSSCLTYALHWRQKILQN